MKLWWLWQKREKELEKEIQHHLRMAATERKERGASVREAEARARREFGNVGLVKEVTRDAWGWRWLEDMIEDIRYGIRVLSKNPGFSAVAVLTLAIGIGANSAIFTLLDAAILKPLPVKDADSLRIIEWTNREFPDGVSNVNGDYDQISGTQVQASSIGANLYRRLAREQTAFSVLIGVADPDTAAIANNALPAEQVSLQYVSDNFFQGLGILPVLGRPFRDDEDRVGQEPVVIVSHRLWMERFGGAREALNRNININNVPAHIVGVAPPGFFGLRAGQWTDVYAPLGMRAAFEPGGSGGQALGEDDRDWWVRQVGRLKPGVPEGAAKAQLRSQFRQLAAAEMSVEPGKVPELVTLPGRRGFNALNRKDSNALWILTLLVGVLLLIVCANVANLMLSRSVAQQRESAVRLALGATRLRVFRQRLTESGVLGLVGGAVGLAFGYVLAGAIQLLLRSGLDASKVFDLHLDLRVLACTGALSIFTALLFGSAPALQAARAEISDTLKAQTRSVIGGPLRVPRVLVSAQIALCMTALVAAGLLGHSLENLKWTEVGFDRQNLAYVTVNPGQAGYPQQRLVPYMDRLRQELARLPGVLQVSNVHIRLLSGNGDLSRVSLPGQAAPIEKGVVARGEAANVNWVGDGFFDTLRIPLLSGRKINERDIHANADVVVVDELFARQFFPNQNPLGHRFGFDPEESNRFEIVGIVGNARYNSLRDAPLPTVYEPFVPDFRNPIHFAIRTTADSGGLANNVRAAVASVDPGVPVTEFHTQNALIDRLLRTERLLAMVSAAFGLVALTLAAVGIGGVLAYAVARRTNEIGVRMALGAAASDVIRMVMRDAMWMAGAGILVGLPCAYAIGKILKAMLFHIEPFDPRTAALSLFTLLAVALLAAWLPARRAMRVDPVVALRYE
jgi:predicted permease